MSFFALALVGCSDNNAGPGAGTLIAGITTATLGTVADLPAEAVVEATAKVVAEAAAIEAGQTQTANATPQTSAATPVKTASSSGPSGASSGFVVDKPFSFTCRMTGTKTVQIKAKSTKCADAMRAYARAAGCNEIDDLQATQDAYYRDCKSEM